MEDMQIYKCQSCGNELKVPLESKESPECCTQRMEKLRLPVCEMSNTAEHSRFDEPSEPCDDGRSGR